MSQTNDCICTPPAVEIPVYGPEALSGRAGPEESPESSRDRCGHAVGAILLLPFRKDELPVGWHFCNGAAVSLDSDQGRALNALPAGYKADWGITTLDGAITLPNLFSEDGRGCFLRPWTA